MRTIEFPKFQTYEIVLVNLSKDHLHALHICPAKLPLMYPILMLTFILKTLVILFLYFTQPFLQHFLFSSKPMIGPQKSLKKNLIFKIL
jgi:hypothetical protein